MRIEMENLLQSRIFIYEGESKSMRTSTFVLIQSNKSPASYYQTFR